MSYEITHENAGELVDVAELLHGTFGQVTDDGVLINQQTDGRKLEVAYSLPETPEVPFRTLSMTEYAAEFVTVSGNDLEGADFASIAKFVDQCRYVGRWLAEPMVYRGWLSFEDIKAMQTTPPQTNSRSLAEIAASTRCMDEDARRVF